MHFDGDIIGTITNHFGPKERLWIILIQRKDCESFWSIGKIANLFDPKEILLIILVQKKDGESFWSSPRKTVMQLTLIQRKVFNESSWSKEKSFILLNCHWTLVVCFCYSYGITSLITGMCPLFLWIWIVFI